MGESVAAEFRKYAGMIRQLLGWDGAIAITSESATSMQVERGTVLPLMLDSVSSEGLARVELVGGPGAAHCRTAAGRAGSAGPAGALVR